MDTCEHINEFILALFERMQLNSDKSQGNDDESFFKSLVAVFLCPLHKRLHRNDLNEGFRQCHLKHFGFIFIFHISLLVSLLTFSSKSNRPHLHLVQI